MYEWVGVCMVEQLLHIILCLSQYIILKRQLQGVCCRRHWQLESNGKSAK